MRVSIKTHSNIWQTDLAIRKTVYFSKSWKVCKLNCVIGLMTVFQTFSGPSTWFYFSVSFRCLSSAVNYIIFSQRLFFVCRTRKQRRTIRHNRFQNNKISLKWRQRELLQIHLIIYIIGLHCLLLSYLYASFKQHSTRQLSITLQWTEVKR